MKNSKFTGEIKFSNHAINKKGERFISTKDIQTILIYGSTKYRQNTKFHYIREKNVPNIEGLNTTITSIVVLTSPDDTVITCYYNDRPQKHISKKNKRYSNAKKKKLYNNGLLGVDVNRYLHGEVNLS